MLPPGVEIRSSCLCTHVCICAITACFCVQVCASSLFPIRMLIGRRLGISYTFYYQHSGFTYLSLVRIRYLLRHAFVGRISSSLFTFSATTAALSLSRTILPTILLLSFQWNSLPNPIFLATIPRAESHEPSSPTARGCEMVPRSAESKACR